MLQVLDQRWKEHLGTMDHLRQGIHLRAYAQKQPKQEYKRESFELFQEFLYNVKRDVIKLLSRVELETPEDVQRAEDERRKAAERQMEASRAEAAAPPSITGQTQAQPGPGPAATPGPGPGGQAPDVTCLLYTSPSPRDATLSRMPSSA